MVYPQDRVLFDHCPGFNTDTCYEMEKTQKQWKKPEAKIIYYTVHLYKVSRTDRFIEIEWRVVILGLQVEEEMGRNCVNGQEFPFQIMMSCNRLVVEVAKHCRLLSIAEFYYFFREGLTI